MDREVKVKVVVQVRVENLEDEFLGREGLRPSDHEPTTLFCFAIVDPETLLLSLPKRQIEALGLRPLSSSQDSWANSPGRARRGGAVRLTIEDRDCVTEVEE
jgi:hypothetical protein